MINNIIINKINNDNNIDNINNNNININNNNNNININGLFYLKKILNIIFQHENSTPLKSVVSLYIIFSS